MLCLDGGGIRGILTLKLLEKLEAIAGIPCYQLFDMAAGTSTGAIIAGLIAKGKTAAEISQLYENLVNRVFISRGWASNRFFHPPAYTKEQYRGLLREIVGTTTTMKSACDATGMDLMITSVDVAEGEETFFSYFRKKADCAYKDVLLRGAMEATMSAPTYFLPLERFVDGGTTSFNNPSLSAILEASKYGPSNPEDAYLIDKLTVFSFGTGCGRKFVDLKEIKDPSGPDAVFWLNFVMDESGDDASDMQTSFLRAGIVDGLDYRRFQISLDAAAVNKIPDRKIDHIKNVQADWLHQLTDGDLAKVDLDDVTYFDLMATIGLSMADFITDAANAGERYFNFRADLAGRNGNDLLVTRKGNVTQIAAQMGDPKWLDKQDA
jgi:hypothetical protein